MPNSLLLLVLLFAAGALFAALLAIRVRRRSTWVAKAALVPPARYFAVLEFDRFISMRNTIGFEIANRVLAVAGERVCASMQSAQLGRMGPSTLEFTFRSGTADRARSDLCACLELLEEKIEASGVEFRLKGTVAYAPLASPKGAIPDALIDTVITTLVREGPERVRAANSLPRGASAIDELEILRALPQAMASDELALHYQPKFDCRAATITSAEALLRWHSPLHGMLPTDRIIALAERTGAIRDLTLWVVERASRDQAAMQAAGKDLTIFINLSGMLIADRPFVLKLLELIGEAPGKLGIEITETAVIDDPDAAIRNIDALSAAGIPVAIDDFGSGLSSLAYLKRLPANELKIDKVFVSGLTNSNRDPLIVRASIDLAHALEMKVTAEGVDDPMSLSLLQVMGCDMLQGYFISRPVPLPQLLRFLDSDHPHLSLAAGTRLGQGRQGVVG